MKIKLIRNILIITAVLMSAGCAVYDGFKKDIGNSETVIVNDEYYGGTPDFKLTKLIAENYVNETGADYDWEGAVVGDFYPMYNPASGCITYLEYKVTKDGKDRGYVLVGLKDDEPRVIESSHGTNGTCFELLKAKAGTDKIKAVRFSFASYAALSSETVRSEGEVLAALGNIEYELSKNGGVTKSSISFDKYSNLVKNYKTQCGNNGGYFDVKQSVAQNMQKAVTRGSTSGSSGKKHKRCINYYASTDVIQYPLMRAKQFAISDYKSGCVPTSAVIICAYWDRMKGIDNMYPGTPEDDAGTYDFINDIFYPSDNFKEIVHEMRNLLDMSDQSSSNTKVGMAIYLYSLRRNHDFVKFATYTDIEHSGSYNLLYNETAYNDLMNALNYNWPASLGYTEKYGSNGGHSAVIYKILVRENEYGEYFNATFSIDLGWWTYTYNDGNNESLTNDGSSFTKDVTVSSYECRSFVTVRYVK